MHFDQLELMQAVSELLQRGESAALATVVRTGGSTPQSVGARLLLRADGSTLGTVGGGRIEHVVREELAEVLRSGGARTKSWDLAKDLGMCCGGRMELLIEAIEGAPRMIVFGAGHVAAASVPLLTRIGFRVTVVDEREALCSAERFPDAERMTCAPDEALQQLALDERDFVLIVTQDHREDERALERVLALPHRYVGMIGSRRKVLRVLERITARRGALDVSRLFAPVGLDLGAVGPHEIAVSIAAQLVALRRARSAAHLTLGHAAAAAPAPARAPSPAHEEQPS
jgi:xanthine dehydrogenase accessory factor